LRRRSKALRPCDLDMQAWHSAMDSKYFTYVHRCRRAARMVGRKRGAIVNIVGQGGKVANPSHLPGGSANAALMLVSVDSRALMGAREFA